MNDRLVTHVTLVTNIKCVLGGVKVTDFNKVQDRGEEWVGWLKNDSKAFGDYFVVSRRQKMKAFKDTGYAGALQRHALYRRRRRASMRRKTSE
jgi:hypothetical protein